MMIGIIVMLTAVAVFFGVLFWLSEPHDPNDTRVYDDYVNAKASLFTDIFGCKCSCKDK